MAPSCHLSGPRVAKKSTDYWQIVVRFFVKILEEASPAPATGTLLKAESTPAEDEAEVGEGEGGLETSYKKCTWGETSQKGPITVSFNLLLDPPAFSGSVLWGVPRFSTISAALWLSNA